MKSNDCLGAIHAMNFAALDLNLLRVLDAMFDERNTSRAGARVGLSQPAVSAALARLRHATGDDLFVREGNRMVPTARAEAMAGPVRAALSALERTLAAPERFEPDRATRRFRLHGADYFSTLLMPPLAVAVQAAAPGVVLQLLDRPGGPEAQLVEGADLVFDILRPVPDWVEAEVLFDSMLVGVSRPDNPVLAGVAPGATVPDAVFAALRHGILASDGSVRSTLDAELEAHGIRRRVVLTVPHFAALARACAEGGLFAALPRHFARSVAPELGLALYGLPVPGPRVQVAMFWHARNRDDPGSMWLREKLREICAALAPEPEIAAGR